MMIKHIDFMLYQPLNIKHNLNGPKKWGKTTLNQIIRSNLWYLSNVWFIQVWMIFPGMVRIITEKKQTNRTKPYKKPK